MMRRQYLWYAHIRTNGAALYSCAHQPTVCASLSLKSAGALCMRRDTSSLFAATSNEFVCCLLKTPTPLRSCHAPASCL